MNLEEGRLEDVLGGLTIAGHAEEVVEELFLITMNQRFEQLAVSGQTVLVEQILVTPASQIVGQFGAIHHDVHLYSLNG